MGVEDIVKYVKSTPHNTNPNVIKQMVLSEEEALLQKYAEIMQAENEALLQKYTMTSDMTLECLIETGTIIPLYAEGKILLDSDGRILTM